MAAAGEQAQEGRLEGMVAEVERSHVTVQVVDRDERQRRPHASALAALSPTRSAPASPGPLVTATSLDAVEGLAGLGERFGDRRDDELEVPARGDLGDDAAEARVQLGLGGDDVGEDATVRGHERGRGLVAGGLEPEDQLFRRALH